MTGEPGRSKGVRRVRASGGGSSTAGKLAASAVSDWYVLFHDDKAVLHGWLGALRDFAAGRLRLQLHPAKCQVFPTRTGVPFLGFRHFGSHRRLKRPGVVRFRRLRALQHDYSAGKVSQAKVAEAQEENDRPVPGRRKPAKHKPRRPPWYAPAGADAWGGALL